MLDQPTSNQIIGDSILFGEAYASEFRSALTQEVIDGKKRKRTINEILRNLFTVGSILSPIFAGAFWRSDMMAWLAAYNYRAQTMPTWLQDRLYDAGQSPPDTPIVFPVDNAGDGPERIRFPKIEKAAKSLLDRRIVTREEFDELSETAKGEAFTIAGNLTERTIGKVRDTLSQITVEGPSLEVFTEKVESAIGKSAIGAGHLENVYRTGIQSAYRDGNESVMQNPIVAAVFPYQEYIPIHDGRVRSDHLALGSLGLNGTSVYRRDDPFWDFFTPPIGFKCRCGTNALTIEAAARKGVLEAQLWLETGNAPAAPEHRLEFIPFEPPEGFGKRFGKLVVAA